MTEDKRKRLERIAIWFNADGTVIVDAAAENGRGRRISGVSDRKIEVELSEGLRKLGEQVLGEPLETAKSKK